MPGRIVLYGATGYTGALTAEAMVASGARPVLAGRDQSRLSALAARISRAGDGTELETAVVAAEGPRPLRDLIGAGDVLVSTAGPFMKVGRPVVAAAVDAGAVYLDSSGEPPFIRQVFEEFGPRAERTGAVLLTAFGYDYLPGNLAGALALQAAGPAATRVEVGYFVRGDIRGATSAGTRASATGVLLEPGYAWRGGRIVTERTAAHVTSFEVDGQDREAFSTGSSEHFALPRLRRADGLPAQAPLTDVDVYLGWLGRATRLVHYGSVLATPVSSLPVTIAGYSEAILSREELFAGWRLFVERLAATRPVILLVEDAQHANAGLLDFLDHLIDWVRDLPLYVLVFARPELIQSRPGFGTGRNRSVLRLDPLDPAAMDQLVQALVPAMPDTAQVAITGQAQGLPLFAVETIRALIDRDIVQPVEGVYRLVGDLGELEVPGSLHALLAARLDALDPAARQVTADAAVLGTSFPAEALIAVSGRDEQTVRAALAELLRREILTVSADPLSPERGSYQFTQDLLRRVAYDTLSRRDRKARHLAVAAHLRQAFPGDGEEVAVVIARHYADALHAVPGDSSTEAIREQAITAYIRAADRADRTGAPAAAATAYATAAQLTLDAAPGDRPDAGTLWERAADAALSQGDPAGAADHAARAREYHTNHGQRRAAARAQALEAEVLQTYGRYAEARELFVPALAVLQEEPDRATIRALRRLAGQEAMVGSQDADRLTTEALILGQALGSDPYELAGLLGTRATYLIFTERPAEALAYLTQAVRFAEQAGDMRRLGDVLLNLAFVQSAADPAAAAETARTAAGHLRQVGDRSGLGGAIENLVQAQLFLGDWAAADDILAEALDVDKLEDRTLLAVRGWLAALRGDADTARATLAGLPNTDDVQEQAGLALGVAFSAAAEGSPGDALAYARRALAHADVLGLSHETMRWAWPLAARAAFDLNDTASAQELIGQLDAHPPGHLGPMLRAERDLARAWLADRRGEPGAGPALAAAINRQREDSTPYHLAHGLLDQSRYYLRHENADAAGDALAEARAIARQLSCVPLLERAAAIEPVTPRQRSHTA